MTVLEVLTYPDKRLTQKSQPVAVVDDRVRALISDLFETMRVGLGIGLAAPQVAVHERIVVIDCGASYEATAFINPEVVARSSDVTSLEGCLSVPEYTDEVKRAARVTVNYLDTTGQAQQVHATGLLAIVLQHEIDHLDGILFVDRLSRLTQDLVKKRLRRQAR